MVVDLHDRSVIKLVDEGVVPVPEPSGNYDEESLKPYKPAMNPIQVSLPAGPSYSFDGSFVDWGPWRFHVRLDRRSEFLGGRPVIAEVAAFAGRLEIRL